MVLGVESPLALGDDMTRALTLDGQENLKTESWNDYVMVLNMD